MFTEIYGESDEKIITSLIAILVVTNLEAQQRTPKLVVCITVDQLRGDYIEYFYNTFGERGFKRLMNEGLVYNNIRFEFSDIDQASAFATLFTGSNPCFSGIAGEKTFDFEKEKEVSILMILNIWVITRKRIIRPKIYSVPRSATS